MEMTPDYDERTRVTSMGIFQSLAACLMGFVGGFPFAQFLV